MVGETGAGTCNTDIEARARPVEPDAARNTGEDRNDRAAVKARACQKSFELGVRRNAHGHHTARCRIADHVIEHEQPQKQEGIVQNQ